MDFSYQKTSIGEHDFHKPACAEYCPLAGEYCPFLNEKRTRTIGKIVRWSDIADAKNVALAKHPKNKNDKSEPSISVRGYTADFSVKSLSAIKTDYTTEEIDSFPLQSRQYLSEINQGKYTCWGDGSGFEYDKMSRNVIGPGCAVEDVYDITSYGIGHDVLKFSGWNAWLDKFQYDYRFGRVSDTNAETVLFPNVDNPWMFTEYVFKGIGNSSGLCAWEIPQEYVVEPPLFNENTLALANGDGFVSDLIEDYEGKYSEEYARTEQYGYRVKKFRKITDWNELDSKDYRASDSNIKYYGIDRLMNCTNEGVRLYCAKIPVQSIKWGEHGNIPPHTLDMTAPEDWLVPGNSVVSVKAVYDQNIGAEFRAPWDGVIEWDGSQAYIYRNIHEGYFKDFEMSSEGKKVYLYSGSIKSYESFDDAWDDGCAVAMPKELKSGEYKIMTPAKKMMGEGGTSENYCHGGCGLCAGYGTGNSGRLHCKYLDALKAGDVEIYQMNDFFYPPACLAHTSYGLSNTNFDEPCPHYVGSADHPVIATYQSKIEGVYQAQNPVAQFASMTAKLGLFAAGGVTGLMVGATLAASGNEYDKILALYQNLCNRKDAQITTTVRYEPVLLSPNPAKLNKTKYNEFGKGVQIVPGTGQYAIDSQENTNIFSGGDTNVYNDISTLSFHRFFCSVMHCAKQGKCNEVFGTVQKDGFSPYKRAGGDGECRYYKSDKGNSGCPHSNVPKRAVEFCNVAILAAQRMAAYAEEYNTYIGSGISEQTLYEKKIFNKRKWIFEKKYSKDYVPKWAVCQYTDEVAVVAVKYGSGNTAISESVSSDGDFGGIALKADPENLPPGYLMVGKFSTQKLSDGKYKIIDKFYWYQPLDNNGGTLSYSNKVLPELRQHVDKNGFWFCRADDGFVMPTTNCVMVDNEEKFIGGWHPEYKDYSKIGSEFIQDVTEDYEREGMGMGDYVQNGDYTPMPKTVNKKGYWIDQSGEYILDERSIGTDKPIAGNDDRETNSGAAVCISFKKSNTEINGETGEKISPKTINGAVFSNDPYDLVYNEYRDYSYIDFSGKKHGLRPEFFDPDKENIRYYAPCIINNPLLLPTMRHALHCPSCDYYIPVKYRLAEKCPWCGSAFEMIYGDDGSGFKESDNRHAAEGKTWDEDLPMASVMKKFFKIYAIGNAEVWAPPGTALKTDAYFWKHQAQINNSVKKQIYHRLGDARKNVSEESKDTESDESTLRTSNEQRGGYLFNKMTPTSEMTLGYPEGMGKFYKVPLDDSLIDENNHRYSSKAIKWEKMKDDNGEEHYCADAMYNPLMPRHMIPEFYGKKDEGYEDEGIIAPFTKSSSDALKMVSLDQMKILRNAIEPTYAYVLDSYSSDFPTYRASYDKRESATQAIIYRGRRSTISTSVLAVTDDNVDSYQTYYSGDLVYGNVREYFPSGYTWWYLNDVLGGRFTLHKGGYYHMDVGVDESGNPGRRMSAGSGGEFTTGFRTVSKCAVSIYGILPLDKEIVAAYAIISPSSVDPSKDPIGRSWNGGQEMLCHYHAFTVDHYGDGVTAHRHGRCGWDEKHYWDENGNEQVLSNTGEVIQTVVTQDESNYALWGSYSHKIDDDRGKYYDDGFVETMKILPCLYDTEFYRNVGKSKNAVYGYGSESSSKIGYGYDSNAFGSGNPGFVLNDMISFTSRTDGSNADGISRYQYVLVDEDNNLVLKYPNSVVWKQKTKEEIETEIQKNTFDVEITASDGTVDHRTSYVFKQTNSTLYGKEIPAQSQPITNYFDMSWTNTRGYVYGTYSVDSNETTNWSSPAIYQDAEGSEGGSGDTNSDVTNYSGGNNNAQCGTVSRLIDITEIVKSLYENRIEREFNCFAGKALKDILSWSYYQTEKGSGIDDLDADIKYLNSYLVKSFDSGIECEVISDGYRYPELGEEISVVPTISNDGDKYKMAEFVSKIYVSMSSEGFEIDDENCNYEVVFYGTNGEPKINSGSLDVGEIRTYEEFEEVVTTIFSEYKSYEKMSETSICVECVGDVQISNVDGNIYPFIGLNPGDYYFAIQNRIISVSSYYGVFHPMTLESSFAESLSSTYSTQIRYGWKFRTYSYEPQSFVMDLLRAPLCKLQKGWRYEEGYKDYSSAKCKNPSCKAHWMTCSVAANASGIYFDGRSSVCPKCGTSLEGAEGVVDVAGDGIMTYEYEEPFEENPMIRGILCSPNMEGGRFSRFNVLCRNSSNDEWMDLYSIKNVDDNYVYFNSDTNTKKIIDDLDTYICEFTDEYSLRRRARYVKVEIQYDMQNVYHQYRIVKFNGYQLVVRGDFSAMGNFSFAGIYARIGAYDETSPLMSSWIDGLYEDNESSFGDMVRIVSAQMTSDDEMVIILNRYYPYSESGDNGDEKSKNYHNDTYKSSDAGSGNCYIKFFVEMQIGGIDRFDVFGKAYISSDAATDGYYMTVNGSYDTHRMYLDGRTFRLPLPEAPTLIRGVYAGVDGSYDIKLDESDNISTITWNTELISYTRMIDGVERTFKERRIIGGTYYYDEKNCRIVFPNKDSNGIDYSDFGTYIVTGYIIVENPIDSDGSSSSSSSNPDDLSGYELDKYDTSRVANTAVIEYFSGTGKEITIKANACGEGPSYMLEKDSIRTILDYSNQFASVYSGKIYDRENNKTVSSVEIPWTCRNNVPCRLDIEDQSNSYTSEGYSFKSGEFRKPTFTGKELSGEGIGNDKTFIDLFGEHCEGCRGKCSTEITFTGNPCTVLSGEIKVRAEKETMTVTKNENGKSVQFVERTGGMDNGMIVFTCAPVSAGAGRVTVCYGKPSILIYARERTADIDGSVLSQQKEE